ncbi:MAG: glycosyl hydrolase [Firmicutes bacterium]|nr:glycosyl hydrolase [Bacillota bacterium]
MIPFGRAVCYSGYRENQSPITRIYPSYEEVLFDLRLLEKHFDYIRMYDPYQHAQIVLQVIEENDITLKVMIGVEPGGEISNPNCPWGGLHSDVEIAENKIKNYEQLDKLAALINKYPQIILAAAVGNECTSDWHHNLMLPSTIASHARYLKSKVNCPVTFCEGAYYWRTNAKEIAEAVDFISIHSYPLWHKIPVKKAFQATVEDYELNKKAFPDKQIIFTEYGWATSANDSMNKDEANEACQDQYLTKVEAWSKKNQIPMFVFEAFDEPWKGSNNPIEPEKHWGIMDVQRKPKQYFKKFF